MMTAADRPRRHCLTLPAATAYIVYSNSMFPFISPLLQARLLESLRGEDQHLVRHSFRWVDPIRLAALFPELTSTLLLHLLLPLHRSVSLNVIMNLDFVLS